MDILCKTLDPNFLIFSSSVPDVVYFSHIPILFISFIVGIYLFTRKISGLPNKLILLITTTFSLWIFLDLVFWSSNVPHIIMFVWSIQILIEPLVHLIGFLLFYVLIFKKLPSIRILVFLFLLYLPLIVITPTSYLLDYFSLSTCLSNETVYSYYSYIIELVCMLLIIYFTGIGLRSYTENNTRGEILLLSIGVVIFLIIFSSGAIIGSLTDNWVIAQVGLFGLPIYIFFLMYSIKRYKIVGLNMLSSEILIVTILILNGSLLVIQDLNTGLILIFANFLCTIIISIVLFTQISRESLHLSKISSLASSLKDLNDNLEDKVALQTAEIKKSYELEQNAHRELVKLSEAKDSFISIAQHNLRIPITNINNKIENLIKNSQHLDDETKKTLINTKESLDNLNEIADEFKNISKIKRGAQILQPTRETLLPIVLGIISELTFEIERLNIKINYPTLPESWPLLNIDKNKIKDTLIVVIENAIKYNTSNGYINISNKTISNNFIIKIENSGLGLSEQEKENLDKHSFYRSERVKNINPVGMGIGLYLAKSIIEAHHGKLIISSNGEDLGATVEITIPLDFLNHN